MSYPYDKTYLEKIQADPQEMNMIRNAYFLLLDKYCKDNQCDYIELNLEQSFKILGEAFELASINVKDIPDAYHFMWDILDALLSPKEK